MVSIKSEEAEAHFGRLARFAGHDMLASGAFPQWQLTWKPTGPGLSPTWTAWTTRKPEWGRRHTSGCLQKDGALYVNQASQASTMTCKW